MSSREQNNNDPAKDLYKNCKEREGPEEKKIKKICVRGTLVVVYPNITEQLM